MDGCCMNILTTKYAKNFYLLKFHLFVVKSPHTLSPKSCTIHQKAISRNFEQNKGGADVQCSTQGGRNVEEEGSGFSTLLRCYVNHVSEWHLLI